MQITQEKLNEIVASHGKWLRDEEGGQRADLSGADLRGADLSDADLSDADLSDADLSGADLRGADLSNADLSDAYLRGADMRCADLSDADLRGADLDDYIVQVVRIGSRKGTTTYNATTDNILCGCWNNYKGGTLAEFEQRVEAVYGKNSEDANEQYYTEYIATIAFFKSIRGANRKAVKPNRKEGY